MGKGKAPGSNSQKEDPRDHSSAPLSTLKDPASFGPPPKHAHYYGAEAAAATSRLPPTAPTAPHKSGWGAPVPVPSRMSEEAQREEEEAEARRGPPVPYRANTTGINPASLPKPPTRYEQPAEPQSPVQRVGARPTPPPRLPPRQNSNPDVNAPSPPPAYTAVVSPTSQTTQTGQINTGAASRLGRAGVNVPGFNIGSNPGSPPPTRQPASTSQQSELASRFAKLGSSSSSPSASPAPASSTGTTWAQKQTALSTASKFQKDPSSVSLSDARSAASTANNFRERHGEQVAAGWKQANGLNQKYGVVDKARGYGVGGQAAPANEAPQPAFGNGGLDTGVVAQSSPSLGAVAAKKAPPPKPPPKRQGLSTSSAGSGASAGVEEAPPPVPLGTKPR